MLIKFCTGPQQYRLGFRSDRLNHFELGLRCLLMRLLFHFVHYCFNSLLKFISVSFFVRFLFILPGIWFFGAIKLICKIDTVFFLPKLHIFVLHPVLFYFVNWYTTCEVCAELQTKCCLYLFYVEIINCAPVLVKETAGYSGHCLEFYKV